MTPTNAQGTQLQREAVLGSGTFALVGGFRNFSLPFNLETTDTTDLAAAQDYRTNKPSLKQVGDITGEVFFDPADGQHDEETGLLANLGAMEQLNFRLVTDTGWYVQVLASVVNFVITGNTGDQLTANLTLRPSGPPTYGNV